MGRDEPCEYLEWDSRFFGLRIARATTNRLTLDRLKAIVSWCKAREIACLYLLTDSTDREAVFVAHEGGFRLVDLRVTLESDLRAPDSPGDPEGGHAGHPDVATAVRASIPADLTDLRAIARQSHQASRFYYDSHFAAATCDALYETWIAKSCDGYADAVLVGEVDGQVAGYVTCHLGGNGTGRIGLFAVAPEAQGKGIGRLLIQASQRWFAAHDMRRVTVVTQGRNGRAQRVYQRCGFITNSVQEWYHGWFDRPATGGGP